MADSVFGVPNAEIFQLIVEGGNAINLDAGSFTSDASTPPETFTATNNSGAWNVAGSYASIIAVVGNAS
jgi:hypothetical protein